MNAKRRSYWPFVAVGAAVLVPLIACGMCGMFGMFASILGKHAKRPPEAVETPEPAPKPTVDLPGYEIVDSSVSDSPIKTQVNWRVVVLRSTTRAQLDALLPALYESAKSTGPSKYRSGPNAFYLYVYNQPLLAGHEVLAVGSVQESAVQKSPSFNNSLVDFEPQAVIKLSAGAEIVDVASGHVRDVSDLRGEEKEFRTKTAVWRSIFSSVTTMYLQLPALKRLEVVVRDGDKEVVYIDMDEETWAKLRPDYYKHEDGTAKVDEATTDAEYEGTMTSAQAQAVREKAQLAAYRKTVKLIPAERKRIATAYMP